VAFFDNHIKMIDEAMIEIAIISSPPATHFHMAKDLLNNGVNVLLEKPMCIDYDSVEKLYSLANLNKKGLTCLFHWRYADEVLFLKKYLKGRNIKKITTHIYDNYCEPGTLSIKSKCRCLMGAWFDSGVNALSFIDLLINIEDSVLKTSEFITDVKSELPVYARKVYIYDGIEIEIIVDWRFDTREKSSVIALDKGEIMVSHTEQIV